MPLPDPLITAPSDRLSGAPVFAGTRVPVQNLFDYLEGGEPLVGWVSGPRGPMGRSLAVPA
jgi:Protein of unknown function (DUF433)